VCGQKYTTDEINAGRRTICPDCGKELVIPKPEIADDELPVLKRAEPPWSWAALTSIVLWGIAFYGLFAFNAIVLAFIPAFFLGMLGLHQTSRAKGKRRGQGFAMTGTLLPVLLAATGVIWPFTLYDLERHKRIHCVNNLKQIGIAMNNYHDSYGRFPAANVLDKAGRPLLSWRVDILPFLDKEELFRKFHLDEPWDSPHNKTLLTELPQIYSCAASQPGATTTTNYAVLVGPRMIFTGGPVGVKIEEITDDTSNTIMVVEVTELAPWTAPNDLSETSASAFVGAGSKHPGGMNALFADGSIRFIKRTISPGRLWSLMTRDGGEVFPADRY
jgi:prepilin-type processing-associated H-X9-DG protein